MTEITAIPYDNSKPSFVFEDEDDFHEQYENHKPVEEYSLDYLSGEDGELFSKADINIGQLATWFDDIEPLDERDKAALYFLLDEGRDLGVALDECNDVFVFQGDMKECALEYHQVWDLIPNGLEHFIDIDALITDMEHNGYTESEYKGEKYVYLIV